MSLASDLIFEQIKVLEKQYNTDCHTVQERMFCLEKIKDYVTLLMNEEARLAKEDSNIRNIRSSK